MNKAMKWNTKKTKLYREKSYHEVEELRFLNRMKDVDRKHGTICGLLRQ